MEFMDPRVDFAFKRLFANQSKKEILISFLNSILMREGPNLITNVVVTDPNNFPIAECDKASIVDAKCIDQSDKEYIIKLQIINQKDFVERSQYYAAMALASQLEKKAPYKKIEPVYFIGVLDFELFPELSGHISRHFIRETTQQLRLLKHLEWHFIELPKFNKKLETITSMADFWVYLLQNAYSFDEIPKEFENISALKEALEELNRSTLSKTDRAIYDKHLDNMRVNMSCIETAVEKGHAQGRLETAERLIEMGLSLSEIAKATQLSLEEIQSLISQK